MKKVLSLLISTVMLMVLLITVGMPTLAVDTPVNLCGSGIAEFDADMWNVDATSQMKDRVFYTTGGTTEGIAVTANKYNLGKKWDLSAEFYVEQIYTSNNYGGKAGFTLGNVSVLICNVRGQNKYIFKVFIDGTEFATYDIPSNTIAAFKAVDYKLSFDRGNLTVSLNGEVVNWTLVSDLSTTRTVTLPTYDFTNTEIKVSSFNNWNPNGTIYWHNFYLRTVMRGDMSFDDQINSLDVLMLKQQLLNVVTDKSGGEDINDDGEVDSTDYTLLKAHILGETAIKGFVDTTANILCLGDSITDGGPSTTLSGYRYEFFEQLYEKGLTFNFVGDRIVDYDYRLPEGYKYHSGFGGHTCVNVANRIDAATAVDYDIVCIMLGTNDLGNSIPIATSMESYKKILDKIFAVNPDAKVFCSSFIIKKGGDAEQNKTNGINAELPSFLENYNATNGTDITFLDANDIDLQPEDILDDTIHPSESGNRKIAKMFADAVENDVKAINGMRFYDITPKVSVTDFTLSETDVTVEVGKTKTVTVSLVPANAPIHTTIWSSDDESVCKASANGRIVGVAPGNATVSVRSLDGNIIKTVNVTVVSALAEPQYNTLVEVDAATFDSNFKHNPATGTGYQYQVNEKTLSTAVVSMSAAVGAETLADYNGGTNWKISYDIKINNNPRVNGDGFYTGVKYGNIELRTCDYLRTVQLYVDGTMVADYNQYLYHDFESMQLIYNNGEIVVVRNGENIITYQATATSYNTKLSVTTAELWRDTAIANLKLSKRA